MDPVTVMVLHGVLMWAGIGFCMPLGMLLVRFLKPTLELQAAAGSGSSGPGRAHCIVRGHILLQCSGLLLALSGGALVLARFGTIGLAHTHARLGLALLVAPCLAALLGVLRPQRGQPWRRVWYAAHWLLGTSTVILGFLNIYIGLTILERILSKSLLPFNVALSVQLSLMALVYLAQDRWAYLISQQRLPVQVHAHGTKYEAADDVPPSTNLTISSSCKTSSANGIPPAPVDDTASTVTMITISNNQITTCDRQ